MVKKVISGLFWKFSERIFAQVVSFIVSIILARLLLPEEYGVVTLVFVFINIADVLVSSGFGEALIQEYDVKEKDYNVVFGCALALSLIVYAVLVVTSGLIADFYNDIEVKNVLIVLGLKIPISSINTIQHAYVSKNMDFKKFFYSTFIGTLISGIIGVIMAYNGAGVWALVAQYLTNSIIDTVVLLVTIKWIPRIDFGIAEKKKILQNAFRLTGASLINAFYGQLYNLVIGKVFAPTQLAYYNKGNQFPALVTTNVDVSISSVMFPVFSQYQNDKEKMKKIARRAIKMSTYVIFPLLIGLFSISNELVLLLLTKKWLSVVFFLKVGCIVYLVQPLQTTNWQIIKALGRSDWCFKLEIIKKIIGVLLLIITIPIGIKAVAFSAVANAIVSMFINMAAVNVLIGYGIGNQLCDIVLNCIMTIFVGLILYFISYIGAGVVMSIIIKIIVGVVVYIFLSKCFRCDEFYYIINRMKKTKKNSEIS